MYLRDITISTYLLNIYVSTQYLVSTQDAESAAVQCYRNTRSPGGGVRAESGEIMRTAGLEEWEHRLEIASYPVDQKKRVRVRSTTQKNE